MPIVQHVASTYEATFNWSSEFVRASVNADVIGAALAAVESISCVIPLEPDKKRPHKKLCPRGILNATRDPKQIREWWSSVPDAGLGFVPGPRLLVADDDIGGRSDLNRYGFSDDTYAERSPHGLHVFGAVPDGCIVGKTAKLPGNQGDIIGGLFGYVVMSPTRGYFPSNPGSPILPITESSPIWNLVRPQRTAPVPRIPLLEYLTDGQRNEANGVITSLLNAPPDIARGVRDLLAGRTPEGRSQSEADYSLALLASFWTRDPGVILAVLYSSALRRPKWNRPDYLAGTIAKALERRKELSNKSQSHISISNVRAHISTGRTLLNQEQITKTNLIIPNSESTPLPPLCIYGTPPVGVVDVEAPVEEKRKRNDLVSDILAFALSVNSGDEESNWLRADGWVRIPVDAFSAVFGVDRKTVQRALGRAASSGFIESRIEQVGPSRKHRLIRIREAYSSVLQIPDSFWGSGREEAA